MKDKFQEISHLTSFSKMNYTANGFTCYKTRERKVYNGTGKIYRDRKLVEKQLKGED